MEKNGNVTYFSRCGKVIYFSFSSFDSTFNMEIMVKKWVLDPMVAPAAPVASTAEVFMACCLAGCTGDKGYFLAVDDGIGFLCQNLREFLM